MVSFHFYTWAFCRGSNKQEVTCSLVRCRWTCSVSSGPSKKWFILESADLPPLWLRSGSGSDSKYRRRQWTWLPRDWCCLLQGDRRWDVNHGHRCSRCSRCLSGASVISSLYFHFWERRVILCHDHKRSHVMSVKADEPPTGGFHPACLILYI